MTYEVGDLIMARNNLEVGYYYNGYNVTGLMMTYKKKLMRIEKVVFSIYGNFNCYRTKETGLGIGWTKEMVVGVKTNKKYPKEVDKVENVQSLDSKRGSLYRYGSSPTLRATSYDYLDFSDKVYDTTAWISSMFMTPYEPDPTE